MIEETPDFKKALKLVISKSIANNDVKSNYLYCR